MSKRKPWHDGLSDSERRLCEEYIKDLNQTRAVLRCEGFTDNYDSARTEGSIQFAKPNIRKALDRLFAERAMGTTEVLERLSHMARADVGDYIAIREDGTAAIDLSDEYPTYPIKKVKTTVRRDKDGSGSTTTTEIELHDPQAAMDKILKATGAYGAKGTKDDPVHHAGIQIEVLNAPREG